MANATPQQLAQAWLANGGDPNTAPIAVAIALAEQGGDAFGINADSGGTQSAGAWQINSANWPGLQQAGIITQPIDLTNLSTNAAAAIYISGNGQNWKPWSTYWYNASAGIGPGQGVFKQNLGIAQQAVQQVIASGNPSGDNGIGDLLTAIEPGNVPQAAAALATAAGTSDAAIASLIADIQGAFTNVGNVFANIGPFAIGFALVFIGGIMLALSFGEDLAKAVEKVASNPAVQDAAKAAL